MRRSLLASCTLFFLRLTVFILHFRLRLQFFFYPVPVMGFPAVKIFCYFLFRQPYPRSFYPFHNSSNDFPVVVLMRLLSLFYPKTAVFLIKPCTDSFFLPLLQMPELLICPQQLPVYLFMIFCPDFFFPLFPFLQGETGRGLLSASL